MEKLSFASDYQEGAHTRIIEKLAETNLTKMSGYGTDSYSDSAKDKIRAACDCADAEVHFLVGGTQTNAVMIDAILRSYQGVIAAETGHISVHEAGAIELGGHKVLALPHHFGKISAEQINEYCNTFYNDGNRDHMVQPGMVYLSQPTEYGTLYSLDELAKIKEVCLKYDMALYVDGARLAYALAAPENDVTLPDLARLCDAFYIGGTKCGTLLGEAVVIPRPGFIPHLFTIIKQHGALLAKGWIQGIQFDTLFTDGLYSEIGRTAIDCANRMREIFRNKGFELAFDSPTNQTFLVLDDTQLEKLSEVVEFSFWEKYDETHTTVRLATSWASRMEDVEKLDACLESLSL